MKKLFSILFFILILFHPAARAEQQSSQQKTPGGAQPNPAIQMPEDSDYAVDPFGSNWDPMTDMMQIQSRLEEFIQRNFAGKTRRFLAGSPAGASMYQPDLDYVETPSEVIIHLDLPGITKENLTIEVRDNVLTISGTRKAEFQDAKSEQGIQYRIQERSFGSFQRSIKLPDNVDVNKIKAEHKNGKLTITIPKTPQDTEAPVKVQVQ